MTTIQISVLIPLIDLAGLLVRVASMVKGSTPAVLTRQSGADRSNDRLDHTVMALDGGYLNPEWAEWLMGWTDLRSLVTERFQSWQQAHSNYSPTDNNQEEA